MSDRFWIIRPSEGLRLAINIAARADTRRPDEAGLTRVETESCTIAAEGLLLQIGQPIALCLASGHTLKGAVRAASDDEAEIQLEHALSSAALRAIRLIHTGFLSDIPNLDLNARRSVA